MKAGRLPRTAPIRVAVHSVEVALPDCRIRAPVILLAMQQRIETG